MSPPRSLAAALVTAACCLAAATPARADDRFDRNGTEWGLHWFPTHVHFGPDNDTLLVGLCHVKRVSYCRIGKYRISRDQWEILPFEASERPIVERPAEAGGGDPRAILQLAARRRKSLSRKPSRARVAK